MLADFGFFFKTVKRQNNNFFLDFTLCLDFEFLTGYLMNFF